MKLRITCNLLVLLMFGMQTAHASRTQRVIERDSELEDQLLAALEEAPVHRNVLTTVFWIGESAKPNSGWSSNFDSAWDMRWKENFGGLDSPVLRKGFFPAKFRPKQNPFYAALPFNDISNPEYMETCPILQSFRALKSSRIRSVCKNRWIEISWAGKVCYSQWQDVGPVFTNDYDYVFRGQEPRATNVDMAGLDISPATRDYLGLKGNVRTTWRFVSDSQVPKGPWKAVVTST